MKLSSNGKDTIHHFERARLVKEAKDETYYLAKEAMAVCTYWQPPEKARISYEFYTDDRRVKDIDNLISAAKPAVDSLVTAGILNSDSGWQLSIGKADLIFANQKQTRLIIEALEE